VAFATHKRQSAHIGGEGPGETADRGHPKSRIVKTADDGILIEFRERR
jgi:hypothetical protein